MDKPEDDQRPHVVRVESTRTAIVPRLLLVFVHHLLISLSFARTISENNFDSSRMTTEAAESGFGTGNTKDLANVMEGVRRANCTPSVSFNPKIITKFV